MAQPDAVHGRPIKEALKPRTRLVAREDKETTGADELRARMEAAQGELERTRAALRLAEGRERQTRIDTQHQIRNILAVVRSISARTREGSDDLNGYAAHFAGRLDALARVQAVLARRLGQGVELDELVANELSAAVGPPGMAQVDIVGGPVALRGKAAQTIGLAMHELATNAVKFGALSQPEGRVLISWSLGPASLELIWRETGVAGVGSERRGFGRDLIERGLAYEIGGEGVVAFAADGVESRLSIPVQPHVVVLDDASPEVRP
jgi:two-component system CheB/CheR fusion protein